MRLQKSLVRSRKLADALATGDAGDVFAAVCDDELKAGDARTPEDVDRLSDLERYRLRHLGTPMGAWERDRHRLNGP